jgi:CheY-like chemotaxis protein
MASGQRRNTLAGVSLVVADDHEDSADLLAMVLESAGADVRTGNNAAEVIELLRTFTPDLLLLDITLPDMDGYELLARVRALPGLANAIAVAVTGHASERDRARSQEAGFAVHVTKPFDNETLVAVLGCLLASRTDTREPPALDPATLHSIRSTLAEKGIQIGAASTALLERVASVVTRA